MTRPRPRNKLPKFSNNMATKLPLSQLLRLGSAKVKQTKGSWMDCHPETGVVYQACAVGMMAVGLADSLKLEDCDAAMSEIFNRFDDLTVPLGLRTTITSWNDNNSLTPEQIAERLEAIGQ